MKEKNKLLIRATTPVNLTCILWHERRISRHQGFVKGKGWVWSDSGQQCLQCCGCDKQIHTDYWNPVEKKGWHGHSLRERMPQPLPGQALLLSNSIHTSKKVFIHYAQVCFRWLLLTGNKGKDVADYFLQINKEKMLQMQGNNKSDWSGYTPFLGELAQTSGSYFKDMQYAFAASTQGEGVLARGSHKAA